MEKAQYINDDEQNWSEVVEDLVAAGDTDGAISLLESVISKFETLNSSESADLQLSSALTHLAGLNSSKGFSLKADQIYSRAFLLKQRAASHGMNEAAKDNRVSQLDTALQSDLSNGKHKDSGDDTAPGSPSSEYDWEAIADCAPSDLLPAECLPEVSKLLLQDTKTQAPKRRGRGTFSYKKNELYSDQQCDQSVFDDAEEEDIAHNSAGNAQRTPPRYGTRHVLVLAEFSPRTKTMDLEKLFGDFKDRGVVIRWVNDTVALAVFRSPSTALEALNSIQCSFTLRVLDEDDEILSSIPERDLEPPRQRPQTTARTAQRLIAQGMGLKLPSNTASREFKKQEEDRRNRILTRQKLRDDAWGDDDLN